ncbi:MAG: hypothetical protein IJS21_00685, partial [Deltaproteobacteria bacterium]|nr:hypothetical protein [Deltaproteobacteria bacterium]
MFVTIAEKAAERSFHESLDPLRGKTVLIYGAGGFGLEMLHALRGEHIEVAAVLDRRAGELSALERVPVYTAEDAPFDRSESVVLFSIVMDKEQRERVIAWLRSLGYRQVIEAQSLRCLLVQPDDRGAESIREYYRNRMRRIQDAESLFTDARSRAIYENTVYSHMTGDYSGCAQWEDRLADQYFPADAALQKGYARFVDCGAYIGDTAAALLERNGAIEAYAGFEPDSANYRRLSEELKRLDTKI